MENDIQVYKEAIKKAASKISEMDAQIKELSEKEDIAVVGYDCRFPGGANSPEKFWELLKSGFDAVTEIKSDRFDVDDYYSSNHDEKGKMFTRYAAFLDQDIREFDNIHFEFSAVEAASIDPQQRLLLEVSWGALEQAGIDIESLKGSRTGVFVGLDSIEYFKAEVFSDDTKDITPYSLMGVSQHSAAGRLSYFYDLKGPAIMCNTACSSSLTALNLAVQSLRSGQCGMAIVGGVNLLLTPSAFIGLSQFQALAPDGRCKTFDASADGFGCGEGCGVVILKKLKDARKDGNHVDAIIKGISVGQDGKTNGFFAPNGLAEQQVMKQALKDSGCTPESIDYIEAHGTGTTLGDTIETQAVCDVFRKKKNSIYIGAVKSNIAHLEAAAGMASLIKVILSMKHKMLPASIHCENPNPNIDWSHIKVVTELMEWKKEEGKRRAGISAFGISGSLAHVIVEEADEEVEIGKNTMPYQILTLSTKNKKGLQEAISSMKEYLKTSTEPVSHIAYTTNILRSRQQNRFACVGKDRDDLIKELDQALTKTDVLEFHTSKIDKKKKKLAFLFTGQGSIYENVAKQLYETSEVFHQVFDQCEEAFQKLMQISVKLELYGEGHGELARPIYSQPAIFSIEYALAKYWEANGLAPDLVMGHSIGEYAASCFAGLLTLEDATKLISIRGKIMDSCKIDGKMAGVLTGYKEMKEAIEESGCKKVSIAAVNAPHNVTISGERSEVEQAIAVLQKRQRVFVDDLKILHPYHSVLMEQYQKEYQRQISDITFHKPSRKMISCITGEVADETVMGNQKYWAEHLAKTVNFEKAIKQATGMGIEVFLEIGGNATLCGLGGQCINKEETVFIPSLRNNKEDYKQVLLAVEKLYLTGISVDWKAFYESYEKGRVELPNYPFVKKAFWTELKNQTVRDIEKNVDEEKVSMRKTVVMSDKQARVDQELKEMIQMIAGLEPDEIEEDSELFSLGFDSLLMLTFGKQISKKYHVEIPLDEFFTVVNTLHKIETYIVENAILEEPVITEKLAVIEEPASAEESSSAPLVEPIQPVKQEYSYTSTSYQIAKPEQPMANAVVQNTGNTDLFRTVFENQYRIMAEQNELMRALATGYQNVQQYSGGIPAMQPVSPVKKQEQPVDPVKKQEKKKVVEQPNYYVPYHKLELHDNTKMDELQLQYLKSIEKKYTSLTKKSKENIQNYRKVYANARNSAGFKPILKEMLYQVIAERGKGSKFIDLDGNEFIDITMGFGVDLFGHAPEFVKEALRDELDHGMPLGPMGRLPGEVARKIALLTGVERVFFCNSGTEADMFAIRLARAVTGRKKIVAFTGAYHGTYDGLLGLPAYDDDGIIYSIPQAPGITEDAVADLVLLSYNSERSLRYIREHSDEIAGVIVETVQSRRPDIQPKEFLKKLRALTKEKEMALIFDEVITGFRIMAGGCQQYFGIEADIITYGKVVGGGMPIGVVSGKSKFMDSVDGGMWCFGDNSVPPHEEQRTYVAGTFCHHPMAMAAANAVLDYIIAHKDTMYEELNAKTEDFANRVNGFFKKENIPFSMIHFGSLFRFTVAREYEIFYYGLVEKGIYIWEGRNCFLSTEHSKEDVDKIVKAIEDTIYEMKKAGYFGSPDDPDKVTPSYSQRAINKATKQETSSQNEVVPMSMIQERLYSQIQISEADPFDILAIFTLRNEINVAKLENVVNQIIGRHEILRSALYLEDGKFLQKIHTDWEFHIKEVERDPNVQLDAFITNSISKFDLAKPPLIEVIIIKNQDSDNVIVFHFHHTAADGISMNLFVQELITLYENKEAEPLKLQYRDFVKWEKNYTESEAFQKDREYWLGRLRGIPCTLSIPYDYGNQAKAGYHGNSLLQQIDKETVTKLKEVSKANGSSLFMMLLSMVSILMHKVSHENDIAVLTPVANRYDGGFEDCIGMFTNTIALSSSISEKTVFNDYLKEVKKNCLECYSHMNYPYNKLIEDLEATGKNTFNIMYVYENTDARSMEQIQELQLDEYPYVPQTQEFDITFELLEQNGVIDYYLRYRTDLFSEESMNVMMSRLTFVIEQVIQNPSITYEEIQIATDKEKDIILHDFNKMGECGYPEQETIVTLFEEQAKENPDKIAVVYEDDKLTYQELNERANDIAYKLRELGVGTDDFVALLTERSIEMIVGILGVLKAGGAYVPIDVAYPEDRIAYTLTDCKPKAVLAYQMEKVENVCGTIPVIELSNSAANRKKKNPEHVNKPNDVAYVIYTSGTTGRPKGVMVEHVNVVRLLYNDKFQYDFNENDVWTMFHSYCFDFSVWEVFGSLLYGGKLIVLSRATVKDSKKVCKELHDNQVTVLNQVPTAFYSLLLAEEGAQMSSVRYLIFGGEALNPARLKEWHEKYPTARIINMYGITETTVHVTFREIQDVEIARGISDIGSAIPTLSVYVMNQNELCGIGVPGELCVAGAGVSRGYLNRPELQAEKFVDNPYGVGKLYRSGDLVRWLPDGNLEYLGRIDEQVKIRGFRIELKEIENVIRNLNYVKDVAVITRKDATGDNNILAYIVSDAEFDVEDMKLEIGKSLPNYMIPTYVMRIESIPVTRNGKLDKRSLPEIEVQNEKEYVAPSDELEFMLCNLFQEILGLEKVGITDDFFELGGHSLRATRLINRIEAETGFKLSVRMLFQYRTVEELSEEIHKMKGDTQRHLPKAKRKDCYPMSSAQKRTYLLWEMNPEELAYNMTCCFKIEGQFRVEAARKALQTIMERHEILRTDFQVEDGVLLQRIHKSMEVDFTVICDKESTESSIIEQFVKPFNLNEAPLIRALAVEREYGYLFLIDTHHIIGDGMSLYIISKEFMELYNGQSLSPLMRQYKDYSEWMNGRDLSSQKEYWIEQFKEDIPILDMPCDYIRPSKQSFQGATECVWIEESLADAIRKLVASAGATDYMVFLSAAMILLSKYARQEDIVIGSPISGRTHEDMEYMLGMFVNTLAMRGNPAGEKTCAAFLEEMIEVCFNAYENQEYPFEELVEELNIPRNLARNPLFDVMLVLQNNESIRLTLDAKAVKTVEQENKVAKFDLTFNIYPVENSYKIEVEYDICLFIKESIQYLLKHFVFVLEQLTQNSSQKIADISLCTTEEEEIIRKEFNNTVTEYSRDCSVAALFQEQAKLTPNREAVSFLGDALTYEELDSKSNQLARALLQVGVEKGNFVAIMAERSVELIVGLCAILKVGCAYIPVDHTYPKERIQFIMEDCKPKAVLTYHTEAETDIPVIKMEDASIWENSDEPVFNDSDALDCCMAIYTSGTTGKPKGSLISNRAVVRLVRNTNYITLTENDIILQTGSISFDASTFEIWGALLNGGKVVMIPSEDIVSSKVLKKHIQEEKVTVMFLTTSLFNQMIQSEPDIFDTLHAIITGGEKISEKCAQILTDRKNGVKLINVYGPTENTTFTTSFEVAETLEEIPIGKPIANTEVYVVSNGKLCGIGVPGELVAGGDGLTLGYLNRPELNEEKLECKTLQGEKIYHTGDLGRWLPDGNLEYMGRIDEQVKIRGFRVELGEIENTLRQIPAIHDAAVIAKEDESAVKSLYAYMTADESIDFAMVRKLLAKVLPDYMIPAYMMQLDVIPLNKNGKLDRRALPQITIKSEKEYEAPVDELESIVCQVMEETLGVAKVGRKDSFLELGGDSIKAIRVVSKMREHGYELAFREIMNCYSVEEIAECAKKIGDDQYEQGIVSGMVNDTPIIKKFKQWNLAKPHHFNQAVMICAEDEPEKIKSAYDAIVEHHDLLRAVFKEQHLVIPEDRASIRGAWNEYQIDGDGKAEVERICNEVQESMKLENGPLVKAALFHTSNGSFLMLCIHHLVVDGVSWRIILDDFNTALEQIKKEQDIVLPKKTASFIQWSAALMQYKMSRRLRNEKDYWNQVAKEAGDGELKVNGKCSMTGYGAIEIKLSKGVTEDILYKAGKAFNTEINDLLLSAVARTAFKMSGQNKVSVTMEGHGREQLEEKIDIDRTVGWFTTLYPIVLVCEEDIAKGIVDTKEMIRKIPNHGFGYGLLEDELVLPVKSDIYFNYLGQMDAGLKEENVEEYSTGKSIADENTLQGNINIDGIILDSQLSFTITYDKSKFNDTNMKKFSKLYKESLVEVIDYCVSQDTTVKTVSDYGNPDLAEDELSEILDEF